MGQDRKATSGKNRQRDQESLELNHEAQVRGRERHHRLQVWFRQESQKGSGPYRRAA